jgi:hypothetical protein
VLESIVPECRGRIRSSGGEIPVAWNFDESGLEAILGAVPHTPIDEGIRQTVARYRTLAARGELRMAAPEKA